MPVNNNLQKRVYNILVRTPEARPGDDTEDNPEEDDGDEEEEPTEEETTEEDKKNIYGIEDRQKFMDAMMRLSAENDDISKLNTNIFGIPHQFLETTDIRFDGNNHFGSGFFYNIYRERPMVTLMPGKMLFLPSYSKDNKKIFGSLLGDMDNDNSKNALQDLIAEGAGTRYYDFQSDYTTFMNYVNLMCRVCAVYLGIQDRTAPDGKSTYGTYDWKKYHSIEGYTLEKDEDTSIFATVGKELDQFVDDLTTGQRCYINFYIDPNSTVSESISNTTQASQLEGAFDSVEGIVKEAEMLLNTVGGSKVEEFFDSAVGKVKDLANSATLGLFKDILGMGEEVLHGSNLVYPDIWMDSEYSKNFSIQINLTSPYGSTEAIYLNVLVPMLHALCLALPRQSSENSFNSPFLVRGYCQGWFSIDLGMVDNITIDRGPEQSWNVMGLPSQVKITLNIKELYGNLMMTPATKPSYFFANQGLIDYLGVICGVDMSLPNIYFNLRLAKSMLSSTLDVGNIVNYHYYRITESWRNYMGRIIN